MPDFKFEPHPDIRVTLDAIGEEKQPIILVDNFINNPEKLIDLIAKHAQFTESDDYYPGVRTPSPEGYMILMRDLLGQLICKTFALQPENISHTRSYLSIVSTPTSKLNPIQQIPHFDGANPKDIAFLHYLCDADLGGTSFYRHNKTGFEYVNQKRLQTYIQSVNEETRHQGIGPGYMNGSNLLFTQLQSVEAKFNRLIIYRGTSLHSGNIGENYTFDTNPQTGRLTVTSFLYSRK